MANITVVGLGPGAIEHITLNTIREIKKHSQIYLRTEKHPTAIYLKDQGIAYKTFDSFYEKYHEFQDVYTHIVDTLVEKAQTKNILYAVPGSPYVAERTVQMLKTKCKELEISLKIHSAMSFLDVTFSALDIDPVDGFQLLDALQDNHIPDPNKANIITQVYSPFIASMLKLKLMEYYDDETRIYVIRGAGIKELEIIHHIPLYQLDRIEQIDYLTTVYVPSIDEGQKKYYNMNNLVEIMERLRGKEGCPWDKNQNHHSLIPCLIEESYEVIDAIEKEEDFLLEEELGDLLLQVIFHSQLAKERQAFTIKDVIQRICEKLIFRHPHVFTTDKTNTIAQAQQNWETQKKAEKQIESITQGMEDIPKNLPSLMTAYKVQKKAAQVGFDWDHIKDVIDKIQEELQELIREIEKNDHKKIEEEGGDLLFAVVNLLRFLKVNSEIALRKTNQKFVNRFSYIEQRAKETGKNLEKMTLQEMDHLWNESKTKK